MDNAHDSDLIFPAPKKSAFMEFKEGVIGIGIIFAILAIALFLLYEVIEFFGALATAPAWVGPLFVLWLIFR